MKIDKELFYTVEDYFDIALHKDFDSAKEYRYEYGLRFTEGETKKIIRALVIKQIILLVITAALLIFILFFLDYIIEKYSPARNYSWGKRRNLGRLLSFVVMAVFAWVNNKLVYRLAVRRLCKLHIKRSAVDALR